MDKQREEFEECYPLAVWDAELQGYTEEQYTYALVGWRQAHAEMQPEIEFWEQLSKGQQDAYNSVVKQLSAANQRIAELLDLVEVVERRNKQLEDRIRVADAEEPVLWMFTVDGRYYTAKSKAHADSMLRHPDTYLYPDKPEDFPLSPLYLHAQIPAEVELKANEVVKEQP